MTAVHDGIYCLAGVYAMYTRFCSALWDTLSALYSGQLHSLHILTPLQNGVPPYSTLCRVEGVVSDTALANANANVRSLSSSFFVFFQQM